MLIRIRSRDGNFRFDFKPSDDASVLFDKIVSTSSNVDLNSITVSQQPRGGEVLLRTLFGRSLSNLGLKHADLIFVGYTQVAQLTEANSAGAIITSPTDNKVSDAAPTQKKPWESVVEDPVDEYWRKRDGKIPRNRDPNFCRHGPSGMCDYCMPLEPYDASYQASHSIKHLSFHAYLRQIGPQQSASSTNKFGGVNSSALLPPLSPLSYRVKTPCPTGSHLPYPEGICTACQPSAITLSRQTFRSVDHLEVASPSIIDTFISSWRQTGRQRFGWLLGTYKPYEEVPMGVKAVVEAIHEPPQEGDLDGLSLDLPWEEQGHIIKLAAEAGLQVVGLVFTDLTPDPEDKTRTACKRHKDSFFLSSLEAIFVASEQLAWPLKTKSSPTGLYSSRLVTAVLSGTPSGGIDLACYMVSEQGCAMVDADMIEATVEPGMIRIKGADEGEGRYVPDVFYTYKNEYGIQVKQSAKPCFPVEYLLVNVTHGFPTNPSPVFRGSSFPIENRPFGDLQDVSKVLGDLHRLGANKIKPLPMVTHAEREEQKNLRGAIASYLNNWHLVSFLPTIGLLSEDDLKIIARLSTSPRLFDDPEALEPVITREGWQTLVTIAKESRASRPAAPAPSSTVHGDFEIPSEVYDDMAGIGVGNAGVVTCPHCTFENPPGQTDCEVCGLPLPS